MNLTQNKKKIINDPVYGFISIPNAFIFDLIEHPWFQRLRRIRQLGLTDYVYPGGHHSRYHHALGALHLMQQAVIHLRSRGNAITEDEENGVYAAILLHDIGHGPFSHALEYSIVSGITHEHISLMFMEEMNQQLGGKLDMCIRIFTDTYPKRFLHRLVSSQLDMDRLDYLNRDSFFTGVVEGTVGAERIIKMLDVANDEIVVQEKGIYSIEKFLVARRLMYWQVYLHKTVLSAENMLVGMLRRACELAQNGHNLFASQALDFFIKGNTFSNERSNSKQEFLSHFARLDDYDIFAAAKEWMLCGDPVLSELSTRLIERNLFRIHLDIEPFAAEKVQVLSDAFLQKGFTPHEASYFVFTGEITNSTYKDGEDNILIVQKNGAIVGLDEAAGQLQLHLSTEATRKYFLCYPKELDYLFN